MTERSEGTNQLRLEHGAAERSEVAVTERSEGTNQLRLEHGAAERSEVAP
ncbi:hypothetical protein [Polymorphospora rubra]|uniref:Uncharacterized protein n=1 Tax=Polymorphospora rubra TaxID=338584 RepID=A0A810N043_9ACTN|nr:hypothetical protein [Polymorphospora rubra]BCJ65589.1 hypothetical protein Prubr_26100 [Polymorphospora rubra]